MKTLYYFICSFTGFMLAGAEADTLTNQFIGCVLGVFLFTHGTLGIITVLNKKEKEKKNGF